MSAIAQRLLILPGLFLVLLIAAPFPACGGDEDESGGVLAVAFGLDGGGPALTIWAGDPSEHAFPLPPGPDPGGWGNQAHCCR